LICFNIVDVIVVVAEKAAKVACWVLTVGSAGRSTVKSPLAVRAGLVRLQVNVYTPRVVLSVVMVPLEIVGVVPAAEGGTPVIVHVGVTATGLPPASTGTSVKASDVPAVIMNWPN
jgi:hypothetical protein